MIKTIAAVFFSTFLTLIQLTTHAALEPLEAFRHKITDGQQIYVVNFQRHPIRSDHFQVLVPTRDGQVNPVAVGPPRTYLGSVDGYPGALAGAVVRADGTIFSAVILEDGVMIRSLGEQTEVVPDEERRIWQPFFPEFVASPGGSGSRVYGVEVGIACSHSLLQRAGGEIDSLVEAIEFSLITTNLCYLRDLNVLYQIGPILVNANKEQDPLEGVAYGMGYIAAVREQWSKVLPNATNDLIIMPYGSGGGGLAAGDFALVGARDHGLFDMTWRHEVGHDWGCSHRVGGKPEGNTLMSGNSLHRLSGPEQAVMLQGREERIKQGLLDDLGPYPFQVPPRASVDSFEGDVIDQPILLDVLANDSDANGRQLTLVSVPEASHQGGKLSISTGTGPAGRDRVSYAMAPGSASFDWFTYRIQDSAGGQALGYVMIRPTFKEPLLLHWSFDEEPASITMSRQTQRMTATGLTIDHSHYQRHGDYKRVTVTDGILGTAVQFRPHHPNENDPDLVRCKQGFGLESNRMSFAAWVQLPGPQQPPAMIISSADRDAQTGLGFSGPDKLGLMWNGQMHACPLEIPLNQRFFCAVSVEPDAAVFYVAVGDSFETSTIEADFKPHRFAGNILAGCSADSRAWSGRADDRIEGFVGEIDEVRVFSIPLTGDQVRFLANRGGTAYRPSPAMGEDVLTSKIALQWAPMPAAKQFDVYVGDNHLSVAEATRTSPAFQATVTEPSYLLNDLDQGTYYWRIDCADESATLQGPVWQFQVQAANDDSET